MINVNFLIDVLWCSLSSFGGPEAHYGVFSNILVQKKRYLDEATLSEMIGVFALVPGPSSTQTLMAIGYLVGGPLLAGLTFLVWALPAIIAMMLIGVFFTVLQPLPILSALLATLPAIAVGFIAFAGFSLSKKVLKNIDDWLIYGVILTMGFLLIDLSIWVVPALLLFAGGIKLFQYQRPLKQTINPFRIHWFWLVILLIFALGGPLFATWLQNPWLIMMNRFYRYGYSVIGGGQIVMPLMIQDLVNQNSLMSLETFLSGYAIDQAIPGPLFSFAAFVGAQISPTDGLSWLAGLLSGFSIFLPGIFLVYFIVPIWQHVRQLSWMKVLLKGISVAVGALIVVTAVNQTLLLNQSALTYGLMLATFGLLVSKKIPAPLIVISLVGISLLF